jgi:hypothetical protein
MTGLTGVPQIPAMTSDAERECYYRLVRQQAGLGSVVELGAWLGASTAYLAAGVRDAGGGAVHVYDDFAPAADHARKVESFLAQHGTSGALLADGIDAFCRNLGPLLDHVRVHPGSLEEAAWSGDPISVLICDAPKDVPRISSVLTTFGRALGRGSVMAWQDFCHFPSYPIPACLYRLRKHFEFVEAVTPGSTLVFRITSKWTEAEVSTAALALDRWSADEVEEAWSYWSKLVPPEMRDLFACGAALFLFDLKETWRAAAMLTGLSGDGRKKVLEKWNSLQSRADFARRYWPLQTVLEKGLSGSE